MSPESDRLILVEIENEMKDSYLTYAMSVIVSRALPDVRDGLKPVHRRVLYTMFELGLNPTAAYKKSGRVVGDVLGKYHPHGDAAIYSTLVRMAQDFALRYPLVHGQGNFGSVDGDAPAAMRYTECKLFPVAMEMLRDIRKNTVDFIPNYDESLEEPVVLPAYVPNLLINGASGIAVGMATNIPPHNITEVLNGTISYIDNRDIEISELMRHIKGPDFPTAGIIYGTDGIKQALHTGRGRIVLRGRYDLETIKKKKEAIIISEIPYQVNKENLIKKVAELVKDKKIDGIANINDESDRNGMRIVIELKKNAQPQVIINQLYRHTQLQVVFGIINLALVNGVPRVLNLKQMIEHFVAHRKDILIRRTKFDLEKAEARAHIVEGLLIALDHIDDIIQLIKSSRTVEIARQGLMDNYKLSEIQATEILKMQLQRLTGLEREKLENEYKELMTLITQLKELLASEQKQYDTIKEELVEIRDKYGDDRKSEIQGQVEEFEAEDLIQEEDNVVTITNGGYIKRLPVTTYKRQKRGGIGVSGMPTKKNEDFIKHLFVASTHDFILFITNKGRSFYCKVHELPEGSKGARGKSLKLILNLESDENIAAYVPIKSFEDDKNFIVMATRKGVIKKTKVSAFSNARNRGIIALNLDEDDRLVKAILTDGSNELILCSQNGYALKFNEKAVRSMGRTARGVKGLNLRAGDKLLGLEKVMDDLKLFVVTENGVAKTTEYEEFRPHGRGTAGQKYIKLTKKTGDIAAILSVKEEDDVFIMTYQGMIIKTSISEIRTLSRTATGVKVIAPRTNDYVVDVSRTSQDNGDDEV